MNFKAAPDEKAMPMAPAKPEKVVIEIEQQLKVPAPPTQVSQDDLFSAHDFDIKIDLDVPLPGNYNLSL